MSLKHFIERTFFSIQLEAPEEGGPSYYALIKEQVDRNPDQLLDLEALPKIPLGETGKHSMAPGAMDAILPHQPEAKSIRKALRLCRLTASGDIRDWRVLDGNFKHIRFSANFPDFARRLRYKEEQGPALQALCWDLAKNGRNLESVKWGITLALLIGEPPESLIEDALLLARYPEFTPPVTIAITNLAMARPSLKQLFVRLLPVSRQWGVITLIESIVSDPDLAQNLQVQEQVLIYGMENHDGADMELSFTVAASIDLPHFLARAHQDRRVLHAVIELMNSLIFWPEPCGGLDDLDECETLIPDYLDLLADAPSDIKVLEGLNALEGFIDDPEIELADRDAIRRRIEEIDRRKYSEAIVITALADPKLKWDAAKQVKKRRSPSLFDQVRSLLEKEINDRALVSALARSDRGEDLEFLFERLTSLIDVEARRKQETSTSKILGNHQRLIYLELVSILGRLATEPALDLLHQSLEDNYSQIRAEACQAIAEMDVSILSDQWQESFRDAVKVCLFEMTGSLLKAAAKAAVRLDVRISPVERKKVEEAAGCYWEDIEELIDQLKEP